MRRENWKRFTKRYKGYARRCLNSLTLATLSKKNEAARARPKARHEKVVLRKLLETLRIFNEADVVGGRIKALMRPVVHFLVLHKGVVKG